MSSSDLTPKDVAQEGRPLRRQATGVPLPTAPTGSRSKKTAARRLRKERSMRIPAIENDMLHRNGITRAMVRATSPKATRRTRAPYKTLLVGIARTKDGSRAASYSEGSAGGSSGSSVNLVRCASPEPDLPASSSSTPQPPKQPASVRGTAEAKGKKQRTTPQSSVVLRPLPSRVAASSSRSARSPLSRTPSDGPTAPETRTRTTRSSGASPSLRPDSYLPRKRSPLARSAGAPVTEKSPSVRSPLVDESTAQPRKLQGKGTSCVSSSEEGDSQSDDHSTSDATSDVGSSAPDTSAADVAQAAAIKQSLLTQIEERNEGKKWDDLLGFFHGLAPSEVGGLLKTATRAGRKALRRLAGKETAESGPSNRENDARVLGRARQPRRRGESVMRFDDAGSDGEGEVMNESIVPPRQRQFLFKAKGKARATRSPSPILPMSPPPVLSSQINGASTSSSHASNNLPAPVAPKRARTPDDDAAASEPPTKRRRARPLVREGAFYEYPTPAQPENDSDADPQPVHMNLIGSFLEHVQDLDIAGWLPRGGRGNASDPFSARDEDDDIWTLGATRRR